MPESKKRRKNSQSKCQKADNALKQKVSRNFSEQMIITGPTSDGIKMSEVLEDFVEPYRKLVNSKESFKKLLSLAIVAWNATLFRNDDQKSHFQKLLSVFSHAARDDGQKIIEEMMERKRKFFPHYDRAILGFEVTDTGTINRWHLSVISTATSP